MRTSVRVWGSALLGVAAVLLAGSLYGEASVSHADSLPMAFQPASQVAHVGDTVTLDVAVSNVTNVAAWQVTMAYDQSVLSFQGFQPTAWLTSTGRQQQCPNPYIDPTWNPQATVFGCATTGGADGASGSAVIVHLTFKAEATGTANIEVFDIGLQNPLGDYCCPPAPQGPRGTVLFTAAVKVVAQGSSDTAPPPTATPHVVPRTAPGTDPNQLTLGGSSGGARATPASGTLGSSGTGTGGTPSGVSGGSGAGGLFSGSAGASRSGAGATGAPHAGEGTLVSRHSMAVRIAAAALAAAGLACFAGVAVARRRAWERAGR